MEKRGIGASGIKVYPFCLGGNVFGWTADEKQSFAVLDGFVDAGLDFIDTADVYSTWGPGHKGGESETVIGNWLKRSGKRDKVIIATKVGKPQKVECRLFGGFPSLGVRVAGLGRISDTRDPPMIRVRPEGSK